VVKQTVGRLQLFNFDAFDLPAGPLGVALGAEYRKEQSQFRQDALGRLRRAVLQRDRLARTANTP
jgi:hypothetical protein